MSVEQYREKGYDMNEFSLSDLAAVTGNRNNDDGFGGGNGGW